MHDPGFQLTKHKVIPLFLFLALYWSVHHEGGSQLAGSLLSMIHNWSEPRLFFFFYYSKARVQTMEGIGILQPWRRSPMHHLMRTFSASLTVCLLFQKHNTELHHDVFNLQSWWSYCNVMCTCVCVCVWSGEGMRQAMSMMWPPMELHEVTHCAYSHAQRAIFEDEDDDSCDWELLTESGSSSGLFFTPASCT